MNTEHLTRLRLRKGWSQAELARRGGINQSHYCQIEKGNKRPSPKMLLKLADLLDATVDELADQ